MTEKILVGGNRTGKRTLLKALRFLSVAKAMKEMSKDPSTQVGAVALDEDCNVLVTGYNGFPRGVLDSPELLNDRPNKYQRIVHAEANLVAQAARVGAKLLGSTVILTSLHPCSQCAGLLIQAGVKVVLAPRMVDNDRWDSSGSVSAEMFQQAGVEVYFYGEEDVETV